MSRRFHARSLVGAIVLLSLCAFTSGCLRHYSGLPAAGEGATREFTKVTLPDHIIAPPDVVLIDAVTLVPRPPYIIKAMDALFVQVTVPGKDDDKKASLIPGQPIEGIFRVEPDGTVNLGFDYLSVKVSGLGIPDAKKAIREHLLKRFKGAFEVTVTLAESRAMQMIRGEHLVQPDGNVNLGSYGSVYVTGLTVEQAKARIEEFLSKFLLDPEISLSIAGFNSRVYYVIFDLDGAGQQVHRLPSTGNETVLDAVAELKGLPPGTSRKRIWIARPQPADAPCEILPVDWDAVASGGATKTNYQILPGDRVFVSVDPWVHLDNTLAKVFSPLERLFGISLLGSRTIQSLRGQIGTSSGGF